MKTFGVVFSSLVVVVFAAGRLDSGNGHRRSTGKGCFPRKLSYHTVHQLSLVYLENIEICLAFFGVAWLECNSYLSLKCFDGAQMSLMVSFQS